MGDNETRPFLSSSFFKPFASPWRSNLRTGSLICIFTTTFVSSYVESGSPQGRPCPQRPISGATSVDNFENEKNPERDHVNFPRRKREELPSPVRHWWIPEEYFSFFAPKTGVTGGYIFALSFGSFLCSKEYIIFEHEMHVGMVFAIAIVGVANIVGPGLTKSMDEIIDKEISDMDSIRNKEIDRCALAIEEEEKGQWMAGSYEDLISAKKENVALQLEAEYRARLKDAYTQVKRRLDYQLQTANVLRANEQKHMVDWIITNVKKSITAKQEEDALKKCVADLKALA